MKKNKKKKDNLKSIQDIKRRLFFEKGGTLKRWMRATDIIQNKKKKEKNKKHTKREILEEE